MLGHQEKPAVEVLPELEDVVGNLVSPEQSVLMDLLVNVVLMDRLGLQVNQVFPELLAFLVARDLWDAMANQESMVNQDVVEHLVFPVLLVREVMSDRLGKLVIWDLRHRRVNQAHKVLLDVLDQQ